MSLALSGLGLTVVATDSRWTWSSIGGEKVKSWYDDFGTKLRRLDRGWAAATGDARLCALGLRELERRGVHDVQGALEVAMAATRDHAALVDRTIGLTHFLVASDNGALEVATTEPGMSHRVEPEPGKVQLRASWAADLPAGGGEVAAQFAERIVRQRTVAGVVHTMASAFAEAGEYGGETMSDEVELGVSMWDDGTVGHLRGKAVEVAEACLRSSDSGDLVLNPPPALPQFPELPAEQRLFTPFEGVAS